MIRGIGGAGVWLALALAACNGEDGPGDGDDTGSDSGDTGSDSGDTAISVDVPEVALFPASPIPGKAVHCVVETEPTPPTPGSLTYTYTWSIDGTPISATTASIDGSAVVPGKAVGCTATASTGTWTSEPGLASGTAGPPCGAVDVSGSYLEAGDFPALELDGDRTFELWFKADAWDTRQVLLRKGYSGEGWTLEGSAEGTLRFVTGNWGDPNHPEPDCYNLEFEAPSAGEWHHVAITWLDATSVATAWVDGQKVKECGGLSSGSGTTEPLTLAAQWVQPWNAPGYWVDAFAGSFDEIRISSTVRYTGAFVPPTFFADDAHAEAIWRFQGAAYWYDDASGNGRNLSGDEIGGGLIAERAITDAGSTACDVGDYDPANNRPTTPVAEVRPADGAKRRPTDDEDLRCAAAVPARDPEADPVVTTYRWFVGDAVVTGQTGATLPASATAVGDEVSCEMTVSDAGGAIPAVESEPTTLVDTCDALEFDGRTAVWGPVNAYDVAWAYKPFTTTGNALTIETWVKPTASSGEQAFVANNSVPFHLSKPDYFLGILGGKLVFDTDPAYTDSTTTCWRIEADVPALNRWHHVAGVIGRDQSGNGTKRLFVDGEEVGECSFTGANDFGSWAGYQLMFGGYYHGGLNDDYTAGELHGWMAGVRMSDTARYTTDFTPPVVLEADADTVSLWRFDEDPENVEAIADEVGSYDADIDAYNPFGPVEITWSAECP